MIEKIFPDRISLTLPTVFGEELTFLEFCGKVRAKLDECIDVVNEDTSIIEGADSRISANTANIQQNTSDIQQNTTDIQQNATAISKNKSDIVKLSGVINNVSTQTHANTVNINTVSGKVDKNTTDIQQNASAIAANTSAIQQNTTDIQSNANYINTIQQKTAENTMNIEKNEAAISANTSAIQQNTSAITANESSIEAINTAFNALRNDFLNKKVESLFAPVILNVENHEVGADINASVYIRMSRIDWQDLGCLYAKVNISFSGATDAKTLKINSIQFGDRKAADITSVSTSFTSKTDVINLPISVVGSLDIPVGTSDISVTGINLLGMSIVAESLASSFSLDSIPTGIDIPCESLAFTSPGGGESDPKFIYTLKISEGNMDIFTTGVGSPAMTERSHIDIDFSSTISDPNTYDQFLCIGGVYDDDSISSISANGVNLGAALINYTEYTDNNHIYNARISIKNINDGGTPLIIKPTGVGSQPTPFGKFSHTSLTFDMFN